METTNGLTMTTINEIIKEKQKAYNLNVEYYEFLKMEIATCYNRHKEDDTYSFRVEEHMDISLDDIEIVIANNPSFIMFFGNKTDLMIDMFLQRPRDDMSIDGYTSLLYTGNHEQDKRTLNKVKRKILIHG